MKKLFLGVIILLPFLIVAQTPTEIGKIIAGGQDSTIPHQNALATNIRSVPQSVERIGFTKVISNGVDTDWGGIVGSIGSGMGVNQTGGNLVITSGTTARSETIIRSTGAWDGGIRVRARSTISQRIVNNNFFIELVDVIGDGLAYSIGSATAITVTIPSNPFTSQNIGQSVYLGGFSGTCTFLSGRYPIASVSGNDVTFTVSAFAAGTGTVSVFGWNYYQLQYQGTTATQANFDVQRNGWASGATTATINTTASPGHLAMITGNDMNATFSDQLIASSAAIQQLVRASRVENVPDDVELRLQIRIANGSTAPASTTTWTIGMVAVSNYASQDVSIQDLRQMSPVSALPVEIMRGVALATQPVSGTLTAVTTLTGGGVAEDAATTASPVPVGGIARTGLPATTVVNGDAIRTTFSTSGQLITKPFASPDLDFNANVTVTTNTQTAIRAAQGASVRQNVTGITYQNTNATATTLTIQDGSTTLITFSVPASMSEPKQLTFLTPLRGTANTALNYTAGTTGANILLNVTGHNSY